MATLYVYPVADVTTTDWSVSPGPNHFDAVNEDPPNETDNISHTGGGGAVERLTLDTGPANTITQVQGIQVEVHMKGSSSGNNPAIRINVYRYGVPIYNKIFACDTSGDYIDAILNVTPLDPINAANWYAGPIDVEVTTVNGDSGYDHIPTVP